MNRRDVVGKLINFRGLVYAPVNEQGVVFLFGKVAHDLGMYVELIRTGYPDCIAKRYLGKERWEDVKIEFEYKSSHFKHDPKNVDIIVCWEHDWPDCPKSIEVIELKEIIQGMENPPIEPPDKPTTGTQFPIEYHYKKGTKETVALFTKLDEKIAKIEDKIYGVPHKYSVYYYSPKRVFATVKILKQALRIHLFTDGKRFKNIESFPGEYGYKWGRMYVRANKDIIFAYKMLEKSHELINRCIKENRRTGWYAEKD